MGLGIRTADQIAMAVKHHDIHGRLGCHVFQCRLTGFPSHQIGNRKLRFLGNLKRLPRRFRNTQPFYESAGAARSRHFIDQPNEVDAAPLRMQIEQPAPSLLSFANPPAIVRRGIGWVAGTSKFHRQSRPCRSTPLPAFRTSIELPVRTSILSKLRRVEYRRLGNIDGPVYRMDPGGARERYDNACRPQHRQAAYDPEPAVQGPLREFFSARNGYLDFDIA